MGWSYDPAALAAALRRVLRDPALRDRLGRNAHLAARRFAWPAVAAQIIHIYGRLVAGSRASLCCDEEIYA